MAKPSRIFISYRRADTGGHAGRLYADLRAAFAGRVFRDVDSIQPGVNVSNTIETAIANSAVVIAVIGPDWGLGGRLDNPDDFVRLEIQTALKSGVRIIPVLIDTLMPKVDVLPPEIASLAQLNAITMRSDDWNHGCHLVIKAIQSSVGRIRKPSPALWWSAAVGLLLVTLVGLFYLDRQPTVEGASEKKKEAQRPPNGTTAENLDRQPTVEDAREKKKEAQRPPNGTTAEDTNEKEKYEQLSLSGTTWMGIVFGYYEEIVFEEDGKALFKTDDKADFSSAGTEHCTFVVGKKNIVTLYCKKAYTITVDGPEAKIEETLDTGATLTYVLTKLN
jgi:TIR domain